MMTRQLPVGTRVATLGTRRSGTVAKTHQLTTYLLIDGHSTPTVFRRAQLARLDDQTPNPQHLRAIAERFGVVI